jgi:uncharacterized protein YdhG (YjbR/CyaY superfamily)
MNESKGNLPGTIDEYISQCDPKVQDILKTLRKVIKEAAPGVAEKISYQMPAFAQNGILVYFAAFKNHIGFFPTANGISAFQKELSGYKTSKGTVQFPIGEPLPYDLITKIVQFKVAENLRLASEKKKK